jgi:hypothetical protein
MSEISLLKKYGPVAGIALLMGLVSGMLIHAFTFRLDPPSTPKGPKNKNSTSSLDPDKAQSSPSTEIDLSSSRGLVEAVFPNAKIRRDEKKTPLDPTALHIQSVVRSPVSSYQKVATLMNLAKTLPPDHRRLAYASASFVCGPQEFQQLMLPLVWDPALPHDQAQVLAAGVVGLADPVRLPICLTLLKHPDDSIRATALSVLAAYFPDTDEASYTQAVQFFLTHPN